MRKIVSLLIVFALLLTACGCQPKSKTDVVATTLPVYDFCVRLCLGTDLSVSRLITESVSCLHDYSLQVKQMQMLQGASLVFISGAGLESFLEDALNTASIVVDCSENISLMCTEENHHDHDHDHHEHDHGEYDPHYWLDPENAMIMAENICSGLSVQFPEYSEIFQKNLDLLMQDLKTLQNYGLEQLQELSCRELITFHDGFSYLANAYDLTILEAVEEEAGSETSASKLIEMIGLVEDHSLPAIFAEANGSTASASVISSETGCKLLILDMAISGDSYFDAMYHNIDTLKEALE